jgi:hypothetical protein
MAESVRLPALVSAFRRYAIPDGGAMPVSDPAMRSIISAGTQRTRADMSGPRSTHINEIAFRAGHLSLLIARCGWFSAWMPIMIAAMPGNAPYSTKKQIYAVTINFT